MNESFYADYLRPKVRWIREMIKPPSYSFERMNIPYTLFWIVLDGTLTVHLDGKPFRAEKGDLVIFPPNVTFGLHPRDDAKDIHYLSLCADLKIGGLDLVHLYELPVISSHLSSPSLPSLISIWKRSVTVFEQLGELVAARAASPQQNAMPERAVISHTDISVQYFGLHAELFQWLHHFLLLMRPYLPDEPLLFDPRIVKACDYIQQRLGQPIRLEELAKHVHVSQSHFSHLFYKSLGLSPIEYVQKSRIQRAKELLMNSSYTIKEIAEKTGYSEQSQLSRAFRKAEGISPFRYRHASRSIPK
ncbi:helix-turn-helix domain-containing protein [Paenibacillus allorhizosphaerae]|nr:AraC family transcriptional regulator [Paenibacillus allorhizosphaerae]